MPNVHLVTCSNMPEADADEALLSAALRERGVDGAVVSWDDPEVDWSAAPLTVIRSTWNYHHDRDSFLRWARRVSAESTTLRNPLSVILTNTHKSYLAALDRVGVPTVPTRWVAHRSSRDLTELVASLPLQNIIIKPAIGAGSASVVRFVLDETGRKQAAAHLGDIVEKCDAMIQPEIASVAAQGEIAVVWIDGEFTHSITKQQRLANDSEQVDVARPSTEDEVAIALRALRTLEAFHQRQLLYARIDLVLDELGDLRVLELELVEPSLFLLQHEPALDRFADAIRRECGVG